MTAISKTALGFLALLPMTAMAHFGIVVPDKAVVLDQKQSLVNVRVAFAHPMEQNGMTMVKPTSFALYQDGKKTELVGQLKEDQLFGKASWKTQYKVNRPGVYQFVAQPAPYWEPAEDKFIVHYTKTVVAAYGEEDGWGEPVGVKTEIVPLTRPFANYAGNVFQGRVLLDGKPVAGCDVEVEYLNEAGKMKAPNDYFVTQVVKTDDNGVFSFVAPWAGWWGFAALNDSDQKIEHEGQAKDVELGAVLWTEFTAPLSVK